LKAFLFGLILGLIALPLGVYFYFVTGSAPVATAAQAMPFEKMLAHKALDARVAKEMPHNVPVAADESAFRAGAQVYRENCAVCHSFSDGNPSGIAKGMFPRPPKLLQGTGVTDDEPGETYWKVANGIRLTGMPAFNQSLSESQMWQVSLLLANADKLPDPVKPLLTQPQTPPALGNIVPSQPASSRPNTQ
jgi:mono/diheme cytochrome c family protein